MEKILDNVVMDKDGCWVWINSLNSFGYGQMRIDGDYWNSHRYAYIKANGEIGEGSVVRHMCHNPSCCNPSHLKEGTQRDNYFDSLEVHTKSRERNLKPVIVGGGKYPSKAEAHRRTGLSLGSLTKYVKGGIFDVESYKEGCKIANVVPKV